MNALLNPNPQGPSQKPGDEMINEIRQGVKFRPVLHALTANPGAELMRYAAGRENMITLGQGEGDAPTPCGVERRFDNAGALVGVDEAIGLRGIARSMAYCASIGAIPS